LFLIFSIAATAIQFSGVILDHPRAAKTLMREKERDKSPEEEKAGTRLQPDAILAIAEINPFGLWECHVTKNTNIWPLSCGSV
jgi:hypothetical protein